MSADPALVTAAAREEYRALRATIRERGSLRHLVILVTFLWWSAMLLAVIAIGGSTPLVAVLPLAVLVAGFETTFALHTGVERIGCYLRVFHESSSESASGTPPAWENTIGRLRWQLPAMGIDPLARPLFNLAILLNLTPSLIAGARNVADGGSGLVVGLVGTLMLHAAALARLSQTGRLAARQLEADLAAFEAEAARAPDASRRD